MPANRLRNLDWQKSLRQVHERGGSLDVTVATDHRAVASAPSNILWRVRLLETADDSFIIERPSTLGRSVDLKEGIILVVLLTIGQNRWMFESRVIRAESLGHGGGRSGNRPTTGLRLEMPRQVERCQRRNNYRVSTIEVNLPEVECWPLLDPRSVVLAERANQLQTAGTLDLDDPPFDIQLPDVGPKFAARLLNLGGGGVGLEIASDQSQALHAQKLFWLRIHLPPVLSAPICATAKVVHTHMTAAHDYYAGLAFDFTFNPAHQEHVAQQIGAYVANVQRTQLLQRTA